MLQRSSPPIPNELLAHAMRFEASEGRRTTMAYISYAELLAKLKNPNLSIADIGTELGVSREGMRQIVNRHFPGVRPPEIRRTKTGRNCDAKRTARKQDMRERALREFKASTPNFRALEKHCLRLKASLEVVWGSKSPLQRRFKINGTFTLLLQINTASTTAGGRRLYAKTGAVCADTIAQCEQIAILLQITKPIPVFRLYMMSRERFIEEGITVITIPVTDAAVRTAGVAVDWDLYEVSRFAKDPLTKKK